MMIPNAVPEEALDYDEIFRRGGANKGDEDFALCQCPHCGCIYLVEYEVDTLYIDARDLRRRIAVNLGVDTIACDACGNQLPSVPWVGPDAPPSKLEPFGEKSVVLDHRPHPEGSLTAAAPDGVTGDNH